MLTQEQIDQAVRDSVPNVLAGLRKEIEEQALRVATQAMHATVTAEVTKWCTENLVPAIHKTLTDEQSALLTIVPTLADGMAKQLAESAQQALAEKLSKSWERRQVFKALFGD